jgi:glycerol uptake facilitator-like aquaporin
MIASALKRKSQAPPAGGVDNDPPVDSYVMNAAREDEEKVVNEDAALDTVIQTQVLKDRSPEAKRGRRQMLMRAVYGEFMATFLFFCPIFCTLANGHVSNWTPEGIQLTAALVTGFQGIGLAFAFSGISGALLNPAIAFALWLTGKLSNRRCIYFILVEMLASIVAMIVVTVIFSGGMGHIYNFLSVEPAEGANLGKVFATEAFLTFFLTYTAFTVAFEDAELQKKESMSIKKISDAKGLTLYATTPQSKTGFAPFSIGFVLFSISLISGTSGGASTPRACSVRPSSAAGGSTSTCTGWVSSLVRPWRACWSTTCTSSDSRRRRTRPPLSRAPARSWRTPCHCRRGRALSRMCIIL